MSAIRILPENLVNQIAAGEVVERAASALKELIDNALDAGATKIQIVLRGYGTELIQVTDNGIGMSREDMHLSLERHATSKIRTDADLNTIRTHGFRGEALPSLASVGVMELQSRERGAKTGFTLRIDAGNILSEEPVVVPEGTTVSISSLFYNVPARLKFLKSPSTELSHLVRTFKQFALANPDVYWSFSHDDSLRFQLPAADLSVRLDELFGSDFAKKTLPVNFEQAGIRVTGVIGAAELNKKSRGDQYLYVNRRPVNNTLIQSSARSALREQLEDRDWPFLILMIEMSPSEVDVNVHPSKSEVKFLDERLVGAAVYRAVRSALPQSLPEMRANVIGLPAMDVARAHPADKLGGSVVPEDIREALQSTVMDKRQLSLDAAPLPSAATPAERKSIAAMIKPAIYQIHQKYLISPISSGMAIIDQHAAHERIIYERALRSFDERTFSSQQLLFPLLLELSAEEDAVFKEIQTDLSAFGFKIRDFGPRAYSIEAVPAGLRRASEVSMIHETLTEYEEFRRANFSPRDALAAGFACKAAIRTGDSLTTEEMSALVDELFATKFPLNCPHGRPTLIEIKLSELDRRFKRTD